MEPIREQNRQRVLHALRDHERVVHATLLGLLAHLGSRTEWSLEDNFSTTETLAGLAARVGLPCAGDQSFADLEFWRSLDPDYDDVAEHDSSAHAPTISDVTPRTRLEGPGL